MVLMASCLQFAKEAMSSFGGGGGSSGNSSSELGGLGQLAGMRPLTATEPALPTRKAWAALQLSRAVPFKLLCCAGLFGHAEQNQSHSSGFGASDLLSAINSKTGGDHKDVGTAAKAAGADPSSVRSLLPCDISWGLMLCV